jgi:hypothetical protein
MTHQDGIEAVIAALKADSDTMLRKNLARLLGLDG